MHGEYVKIAARELIYEVGDPIEELFFPVSCTLSIIKQMRDGHQIEVATIGREGMCAVSILMEVSTTRNSLQCQHGGYAIKVRADRVGDLLLTESNFRLSLNQFLRDLVSMLMQNVACNRLHMIYERCAAFLLLTSTRVQSKDIYLTHEDIAIYLGANRPGVSLAVSSLQKAGLIQTSHGAISIRDRLGLESAACECYRALIELFTLDALL
jgi:CRP-like cAMP-binding protein